MLTIATLTIQTVPAVLYVTMVQVLLSAVLTHTAVTLTSVVDLAVQHSGHVIATAHVLHNITWRFLQDYLHVMAVL